MDPYDYEEPKPSDLEEYVVRLELECLRQNTEIQALKDRIKALESGR